MDINWWVVSTMVLWVLGAWFVYCAVDNKPTPAVYSLIWPLPVMVGIAQALYDEIREYLRRKRG